MHLAIKDAKCMVCSQPSWALRASGQGDLCEPCSPGYHYARDDFPAVASGSIADSERCLRCTENFYCPTKDIVRACQV
jgi:hypothetical protein